MLILDTNVVSEARKKNPDPHVRAWFSARNGDELYLSAVTVLEIQRGISKAEKRGDEPQAAVFTHWLDNAVLPAFAGRILPVDHLIARQAGRLQWANPNDYRDALIAATAIAHGAAVVTRNIRHFEATGVQLVNPWEATA